jgi:hypothetical protein
MSKAAELAALIGSQTALSNRNLIINGAMQVAQRSTSETNFTGSAFKTVDRVRSNLSGGGTFDQEQSTDVPSGEGFINSLKTTVNTVDSSIAAGDYYALEFPLEGQNVNSISGFGTSGAKNLTLSFFVKSSVTGDYSVSFQNGVFDTSYVSKYTISSANTWEKKTISITAKTDGTWVTTNAQGVRIWFSLGTGSTFSTSSEQTYQSGNYVNLTGTTQWISNAGATFYITGVQLEVGDTATPFEHRSFGDELARCQRYYQQYLNPPLRGTMSAGSASSRTGMILPVPMRATPSVTMTQTGSTSHAAIYNGSASYTISSILASYLADFCIEFDFNLASAPTAGTPAALYQSSTLQSKFAVSAEL